MKKKFTITRVKSGVLSGFMLLDMDWTKEERDKFINVIENENPAAEQVERNENGY